MSITASTVSSQGEIVGNNGQDGQDPGGLVLSPEQMECLNQAAADRLLAPRRERREIDWDWLAIEGGEIAVAVARGLLAGDVKTHKAALGAGKTRATAHGAVAMARANRQVMVALATRVDCDVFSKWVREIDPGLIEQGAVAECFGAPTMEEDQAQERRGRYPVTDSTLIAIATHAQLGRLGWSRLMSGFYRVIDPVRDDADAEFHVVVDEYSMFLGSPRLSIPLDHRAVERGVRDKSYSRREPTVDCPKRAGWSNCASCLLHKHGGHARFNRYGHRELLPAEGTDIDRDGTPANTPINPLVVRSRELKRSSLIKVGRTTWAARILSYLGTEVEHGGWRSAELESLARDEDGDDSYPIEHHEEILQHIIECSYRPIVTVEFAVTPKGDRIRSADLRAWAESGDKGWADEITFSNGSCETRTLRCMDMSGLEMLRRVCERRGTGIAFLGATAVADDDEIIRAAFPDVQIEVHGDRPRQIKQIAAVAMDDAIGLSSLVGTDGRLMTSGLEELGECLIFADKKRKAMDLFDRAKEKHPGLSVVQGRGRQRILEDDVRNMVPNRTIIAYARSVLGHGVNLLGLRALVIDCDAFRPISSFQPGELSIEEFERYRAEERVALILQCVGRLLRGDEDKVAVLVLIHADADIMDAVARSPMIQSACREPVIQATGDDMGVVIDQCKRWLASGGGEFPEKDLIFRTRSKTGRKKLDVESLIREAVSARRQGVKWRNFSRKYTLNRLDIGEQLRVRKAYEQSA